MQCIKYIKANADIIIAKAAINRGCISLSTIVLNSRD